MLDEKYEHYCKHCHSRPTIEGPHHLPNCQRWKPYFDYQGDAANSNPCKECGAKPSFQGPHHQHDCPRHMEKKYCAGP